MNINKKRIVYTVLISGGIIGLLNLLKSNSKLKGENQILREINTALENDKKKLLWSQWEIQQQLKVLSRSKK